MKKIPIFEKKKCYICSKKFHIYPKKLISSNEKKFYICLKKTNCLEWQCVSQKCFILNAFDRVLDVFLLAKLNFKNGETTLSFKKCNTKLPYRKCKKKLSLKTGKSKLLFLIIVKQNRLLKKAIQSCLLKIVREFVLLT